MGEETKRDHGQRAIPRPAFDAEVAPLERAVTLDGLRHVCFEWNASLRGEAPTILLVHATGFHARLWDRVVLGLGARHVIAVDQRGHGRSEGAPVDHWAVFAADLEGVVDALDLPPGAVGVGHSMGGHALVEMASRRADALSRLVLVDPVIAEPESYTGEPLPEEARRANPVARRKRFFDSPEAMWTRFVDRHPYSLFREDVAMDYCRFGLLSRENADGEGDFELACAPEMEASVYNTARTNTAIFEAIPQVDQPVAILRAKQSPPGAGMDFSGSPTWPGLVGLLPNARERYLPSLSHFMPMQDPAFLAEAILRPERVLDGEVSPAPAAPRGA